jgi:disulfide bond formation protein DsbB
MTTTPLTPNKNLGVTLALIGVAMAAVVGMAWAFQLNGYVPCKLCLQQRVPYYIGSPLLIITGFALVLGAPRVFGLLAAIAGAGLMVYGIYLGGFHSGVEWGWWQGPTDCGAVDGSLSTTADNLLDTLNSTKPPACDEAAGRFLGLSFAGWNVVASIGLLAACLWASKRAR